MQNLRALIGFNIPINITVKRTLATMVCLSEAMLETIKTTTIPLMGFDGQILSSDQWLL